MRYNIHKELQDKFPFLRFLELPQDKGKIFVWADNGGWAQEELGLMDSNEQKFAKLNQIVSDAREKGLCICSNCYRPHEFNVSVLYGYYCPECVQNVKWIQMTIQAASRPNYYE